MKRYLKSLLLAGNILTASLTYGKLDNLGASTSKQVTSTLTEKHPAHAKASEFLKDLLKDRKITSKELYKLNLFIQNPKNFQELQAVLHGSQSDLLKQELYKIITPMINTQETYIQTYDPRQKGKDVIYSEKKKGFVKKYARQAYALQLYAKLFPSDCGCKVSDWIKVDGKFGTQTQEILNHLRGNMSGKIDLTQVTDIGGKIVSLTEEQKNDIKNIEENFHSILPPTSSLVNPLKVGTLTDSASVLYKTDSSRIYETTIRTPVENESNLQDLDAAIEVFEQRIKVFGNTLKNRKTQKVYDAVKDMNDTTKISSFRLNPKKSQEFAESQRINQVNKKLDEILSKTQWDHLQSIAGTLVVPGVEYHSKTKKIERKKRFTPDMDGKYHLTLGYGYAEGEILPKANYLLDIVLQASFEAESDKVQGIDVVYPEVKPLPSDLTENEKKKYAHLTKPHYSLNNSSTFSNGDACVVDISEGVKVKKIGKLYEKFSYDKE